MDGMIKRIKYTAVLAIAAAAFAAAADAGTPNTGWYSAKPKAKSFTISTADELAGLAQIVNGTWGGKPAKDSFAGKTVKLAGDIDLSSYDNWDPIGGWDPAHNTSIPFSGTFDGSGRVIRGLTINRPDKKDRGLFGYIERGRVKNLGLEGVNILGAGYVGALAGTVWRSSSVVNCYSTGTVSATSTHAGGLAGAVVDSSRLANSYSTAAVRSENHSGGLAGRVGSNSSITSCAALNPEVAATGSDAIAGRIIGSIADSKLGPVTLSNNIANAGLKNSDGSATWPGRSADRRDGADISASEINADGTLGGRFKGGKSGWTAAPGKLPGLGGKTVEMPEHLRQ